MWLVTAAGALACSDPAGMPDSDGATDGGGSTASGRTDDVTGPASATAPSTSGNTTSGTGETTGTTASDTSAGPEDSSTGAPPPVVPGLRAEYFAGYHDQNLVQTEPTLEVNWAAGAPGKGIAEDRFSVRWSGWLTAPASGSYTLVTETDDGVRVWVDDTLVIDDWTPHFVTRNEGSIDLVAGTPVPLRVEYFEIDLDASARLAWIPPGLTEVTIPAEALTTIEPASDDPGPKPPYVNPVVPFDCPDPGVFASRPDVELPGYYMVCTGGTFPLRYSRDLVHWEGTLASILPEGKPTWAANGNRNWAPELHQVGDNVVAYFTTTNAANVLCIGAATAADPLGPYTESAGPLVEHPLGVIDATYYEDGSGVPWLLYKIDGNSAGQPTPILARQLNADGLSFAAGSTAVQLLVNDTGTWEGGVIEAMWVTEHDGFLYMFYSGNVYDNRYRTGVARANAITGPWEKLGPPILANNERWVGPGHGTVLNVGGTDYFFYHAWTNAGGGAHLQSAGRHGLLDRIDWADGWPAIHDGTPSRTWQTWPGEG